MSKLGAVGRIHLFAAMFLAAVVLCAPRIVFAAQHVPPSFVTQPVSVAVPAGQNATFFVVASGSPTLSYQWRFNGVDIPGATDTNLVVFSAGTSNAGLYSVQATNAYGTTNSADASLIANYPPIILAHPVSQAALLGSNVAFHVSAMGTPPFVYRWQFNGVPIPGATDATLTITGVQSNNAGAYAAVVTNAAGVATSRAATLSIVLSPDFLWARNLPSFSADSQARYVAADLFGNLFVAGAFHGTSLDFGGTTLTNRDPEGYMAMCFLAKYDRWGNFQWVREAGTNNWIYPPSFRVGTDSSGSSYLAGHFNGTVTFGTNVFVCTNMLDLFVAKYDSQGQVNWARQIAGDQTPDFNYDPLGFAVDSAGNSVLTARCNNTADFEGVTVTNALAFIAKYDSSGNILWARPSLTADAAAIGPSGSIFLTGTDPTYPSSTGILTEYDNSGNLVWSRLFPYGRAIAVDAANNIFTTGFGWGTYGGITMTNPGAYGDFFVAKCDGTGQLVWISQAGSQATQMGMSVAVDGHGNVYAASRATSNPQWEPILIFGTSILTNVHGFVAKYNPAGTALWAKPFGIGPNDWITPVTLAITDPQQMCIVGDFSRYAHFGVFNLTNSNAGRASDLFVTKLDVSADVEPPPPPVPPQIVGQPKSQSITIGGSRTFNVTAYGGLPLSYQWFFNGTNALSGATDSAFTLTNAQMTNAGNYSVIVTNAYGSATSAVATLTVYPPDGGTLSAPALFSTNHQVRFNVTGIAGLKYAVQASSNLLNWVPLVTNTSPFLFTDPSAGNFSSRYYRSVYVP